MKPAKVQVFTSDVEHCLNEIDIQLPETYKFEKIYAEYSMETHQWKVGAVIHHGEDLPTNAITMPVAKLIESEILKSLGGELVWHDLYCEYDTHYIWQWYSEVHE